MDKFISLKPFLQEDGKVPGAYVNTQRRFLPSFSHKKDELNLTQYIKDIVATVLTGASATFTTITALTANIGKNLFGFGTATAPSITFNGDDNTGIYRSAADTIAFTSGGTAKATIGTNGLVLTKGTATQATDINTTVTLNAGAGVITTQTADAIAGGTDLFTLNNTSIAATSLVIPTILNYTGTTGKPVVSFDNIGAQSIGVVITNADTTNALNGALTIGFVVL